MLKHRILMAAVAGIGIALVLALGGTVEASPLAVVNTDSLRTTTPATSWTKSFDAGAADKLMVSLSTESAASVTSVTYNGLPLALIPGSGGNRNRGIWFLDDPYTGGAADVVVTGDANFNSMGIGIASIVGSADGYDNAAKANAGSVTLNVSDDDSFVYANNGSNNGVIPTPAAPLVEIWRGALSSAEGAAGYADGVSSGSQTFSFTGSLTHPETSAVSFVDVHAGRDLITDLFNTGVDASGTVLADGVDDPHYAITSAPDGASTVDRVRTGSSCPGPWVDDNATSAWIGPNEAESPYGFYTFDTTFTIPDVANLSTVIITGAWAADNQARQIRVNDNLVFSDSIGFGSYGRFTIGPDLAYSYLQHGTNTLSFVCKETGSPGIHGFRVDDIEGSFVLVPDILVPEPSAFLIWALGLLGLIGWRRRRTK